MPCAEVPTFSGSSGAPVIIPQGGSSEVIGMIIVLPYLAGLWGVWGVLWMPPQSSQASY